MHTEHTVISLRLAFRGSCLGKAIGVESSSLATFRHLSRVSDARREIINRLAERRGYSAGNFAGARSAFVRRPNEFRAIRRDVCRACRRTLLTEGFCFR